MGKQKAEQLGVTQNLWGVRWRRRCHPRRAQRASFCAVRLSNVRVRAFYAVLEFKLPAAVLACGSDGLDLGVLPSVTIISIMIFARPHRCPATGLGLYSSVGKPSLDKASAILLEDSARSANIREYVRNCLPAHRKKLRSLPIHRLLVECR